MAGPIRIAILADASQANRELGRTTTTAQRVGAGFRKMALPAVAALGAIGAAAFAATKAASADAAAQAQLAQTLRTAAGATATQVAATEKWITAQGTALGVADDELRPAIAQLATATGDVAKAQKLASVAMDISAGSGKSLKQVTAALAKAQSTGSVTALAKYGVATKDAAGDTKSLSQVTTELAGKYKGAASTAANTAAGKQKRLTLQLGELQEQIGAKLLPVMTKLAAVGLRAVSWISQNEGKVTAFIAVLAALAATVLIVNAAMKVYTAGLIVYKAVQTAITAATKAWTAVQAALNVVMSLNPIGLVVIAIAALVAIIVVVVARNEGLRKKLVAAWGAIQKASVKVFDAVRAKIAQVFGFLKNLFLNFTGPGLIIKHWKKIQAGTRAAFDAVRNKVREILNAIKTVFLNFTGPGLIIKHWNTIRTRTREIFEGVRTTVREKINAVLDIVRGIRDRVTGVFSGARAWLYNAGRDIIEGLIDGVDSLIDSFKSKLKALTDLIPGSPVKKGPLRVLNRAQSLLRPHGKALMGGLIDGWDSEVPTVKRSLKRITRDIGQFDASLAGGLPPSVALSAESTRVQTIHVSADFRLTAQQVSRLQRGKEIRADLDAVEAIGVRRRS